MKKNRNKNLTHEGANAAKIPPDQELRRSVMTCMLWEDGFYESGILIADRIRQLIPAVEPHVVSGIAIEAREKMNLRHIPLFIVREMARCPEHRKYVAQTLARVIQRPDELVYFLTLYWAESKQPLSAKVKRGLALAFTKFDEYSLAKYNRSGQIKLRDVLFMCHAKPVDQQQADLWKRLIEGRLEKPDTWEVALSAGGNKKDNWDRLLTEKKLGGLALLRNLRGMQKADVDEDKIIRAIDEMKTEKILPFRFIAAARQSPQYSDALERSMLKSLAIKENLPGKTVLLVDVSGSMENPVSYRSDLTRMDAAGGLAILAIELCENAVVYSFSAKISRVPDQRGFALFNEIINSQIHTTTRMGESVKWINKHVPCDRLIVFSDEQSADDVPNPKKMGYMINIASFKNGVGYGAWTHIDGWSEAVFDFIIENEKFKVDQII